MLFRGFEAADSRLSMVARSSGDFGCFDTGGGNRCPFSRRICPLRSARSANVGGGRRQTGAPAVQRTVFRHSTAPAAPRAAPFPDAGRISLSAVEDAVDQSFGGVAVFEVEEAFAEGGASWCPVECDAVQFSDCGDHVIGGVEQRAGCGG